MFLIITDFSDADSVNHHCTSFRVLHMHCLMTACRHLHYLVDSGECLRFQIELLIELHLIKVSNLFLFTRVKLESPEIEVHLVSRERRATLEIQVSLQTKKRKILNFN